MQKARTWDEGSRNGAVQFLQQLGHSRLSQLAHDVLGTDPTALNSKDSITDVAVQLVNCEAMATPYDLVTHPVLTTKVLKEMRKTLGKASGIFKTTMLMMMMMMMMAMIMLRTLV